MNLEKLYFKPFKLSLNWFLALLLIIISLLIITSGDTPWDMVWNDALKRFFSNEMSFWNPMLDERIPRLIVILCTGASLAVSGAVMQSLFHNPLASPNILGISCGGALFVVLVYVMKWNLHYPFIVPLAAFLGSFLTLLLVYFLSKNDGEVQVQTLILTGIAISTLLIAIQGAILYAIRDQWSLIQTLTEWEVGSTFDRNWKHVHMQLPLTIVGLFTCYYYRSEMDVMTLGDEEAKNIGVEVDKVRFRLFLSVALLTGGAVAAVGMVAFFGLVLPHVARYIQGPMNNSLIPLCVLLGGTSFAYMDYILRFFEIQALSIGTISAILGGIFFLILMRKSMVFKGA